MTEPRCPTCQAGPNVYCVEAHMGEALEDLDIREAGLAREREEWAAYERAALERSGQL